MFQPINKTLHGYCIHWTTHHGQNIHGPIIHGHNKNAPKKQWREVESGHVEEVGKSKNKFRIGSKGKWKSPISGRNLESPPLDWKDGVGRGEFLLKI